MTRAVVRICVVGDVGIDVRAAGVGRAVGHDVGDAIDPVVDDTVGDRVVVDDAVGDRVVVDDTVGDMVDEGGLINPWAEPLRRPSRL